MTRQIDLTKLSRDQMAALLVVFYAETDERIDCNNGFNKALETICSAPDAKTIERIRTAQNRWSEAMNDISARSTAAAFEIMGIAPDTHSMN